MRLYIAEKPSVGRELAKCLRGPMRRGDGFIETQDGVVTWLFGHVLRQAEPQEYDAKYKRWNAADLPIIPQHWQLFVAKDAEKQFNIVKSLIAKADEIVNGGDPDREGQLLVDEVLDYVGNKKPVKRILLNALDEKSIKQANADLRDNRDFVPLKNSALARARADWLIGMNLSRAYTLAARRAGHERIVLPVGRVKTPTLALVVRREREIENFKPVDYYTIKGLFAHPNGSFMAQWKPKDTIAGLDHENRLIDKKIAEAKLAEFEQEPHEAVISSYQKTQKQEQPPLPFSLSTLQVLAGRRFGYEPQLVLDTAQSLYEKKITTYPRSDCEYLPQNQFGDAKTIIAHLGQCGDAQLANWVQGADAAKKSRAWNDKKISAHHAIIPTTVQVDVNKLSEAERNLYQLIARNYLAQFYPVHRYDQTKIELQYKEELFTVSGRTERDLGWKVMYPAKKKANVDNEESDESAATLPVMQKKDVVNWQKGKLETHTTKPPQRFTPATLLAGMKEIHKYVKNPEAKKQLKDVYGIGTEATRATIIDELVKRKFMTEKGKKKTLTPTPAAYLMIDALPDELTYPDTTAIWEDKLHSMAEGDGTLDDFLRGQEKLVTDLCAKAGNANIKVVGEYACPRCHQGVLTQRKGRNGVFWGCSNYPKCRLTTNDVDGKPDMELARQKAAGQFPARTTTAMPTAGRTSSYAAKRYNNNNVAYEERAQAPSQADINELNQLFSPAAYEAQLAEDMQNYQSQRSSWQNWGDKPKYSANPMEHMQQTPVKANKDKTYLCPHCREGHLQRINGRNGAFWGCSNYPRCTATFDDNKGTPLLQ